MSSFEERLRQANLTPFKNVNLKEDILKLLIKQLYKHQNFKNSAVLARINKMTYDEKSIINYLSYIRKYVKTGLKIKGVSEKVYKNIDECIARHEGILTPPEEERHMQKKPFSGIEQKPKVVSTPIKAEPPKYIERAEDDFGVKIDSSIKLFKSKEACEAYIQCYKEFNKEQEIKLVKIDLEIL